MGSAHKWQQTKHVATAWAHCEKNAQRVVLHRKQEPLELGQLWHRQQLFQISPAVIFMLALAANAHQVVNAI
jgi:hypothetical protein